MKSFLFAGAAALAVLAAPSYAHTSSLGYTPGATAGSVTFWAGSYDHGGFPSLEGAVHLEGVDVTYSSTASFDIGPTASKPGGLVDGTNNFFWGEFDSSLGRYPFPLSTDPIIFGLGIKYWQGVTFTGLAPGTYEFGCGSFCGITQQWESLNGDGDVVRLTLTGRDIGTGGVPEPAMWGMMIAGFGMTGAAMRRKSKKVALAA